MNVPAALETAFTRFDRLSLRERVLILAAVLAILFVLWDTLLLSPLETRRHDLSGEVESLQTTITETQTALQSSISNDPAHNASAQIASAQHDIQILDRQLQSATVGLLPPDRMTAVLEDVLRRQQRVRLMSLQTESATPLVPGTPDQAGPYVHPVQLVLRGHYLDILDYLQELEGLNYRLYWKTLELDSSAYPVDRVRIEIDTISLDRAWLGI